MAITFNIGDTSANALLTGSKLGFKTGTEAALKALTSVVPGYFYLTNDTHRLFVATSTTNVSPINQGVISVSGSDLPSLDKDKIEGQFYLIDGANNKKILVTYSNGQWVKINPDTSVEKVYTTAVASGTNSAIIKDNVISGDSYTHSTVTSKTGLKLTGGDDTKVSVVNTDVAKGNDDSTGTQTEVKVEVAKYTNSLASDTIDSKNAAKINLQKTLGTDAATTADTVTLVAGNGIDLSVDTTNKRVTIVNSSISDITNKQIKAVNFGVPTTVTGDDAKKGFEVKLTKEDNSTIQSVFRPTIALKANADTDEHTAIEFVDGKATLDVYTADEVDSLIKSTMMDLNALTYKGTVAARATGTSLLPTSGVSVGDVYMLAEDGLSPISSTDANQYSAGTLFIATIKKNAAGEEVATEDANGHIPSASIEWTVVKNYSTDTIASVVAANNKMTIKNTANGSISNIGSMEVVADGIITATATRTNSNKDLSIKITHNQLANEIDKTGKQTASTASTTVLGSCVKVEDVTVDNYGHVTAVTYGKTDIPTEVFKSTAPAAAVKKVGSTAQSVTTETALTLKANNVDISTATVKNTFKTDTLTISNVAPGATAATSSTEVHIDLTWGSF